MGDAFGRNSPESDWAKRRTAFTHEQAECEVEVAFPDAWRIHCRCIEQCTSLGRIQPPTVRQGPQCLGTLTGFFAANQR